ncbi:hypothetical protein SAY86_018680 [Trapa natans]|uniref:Uncharacterized protein n=1 Tax=Trapa natans TaxID=22666 RepID=A0AAN7LRC4_TRANT|nr:hypothetical protein SAY86_018680 [Trapa natans]
MTKSCQGRDERMDALVSECSSGCESGWTLYLEQSMDGDAFSDRYPEFFQGNNKRVAGEVEGEDEEEEEDLSMVSDASSGPPHLHEEDEEEDQDPCQEEQQCPSLKCRSYSKRRKKNKKKKKKMGDHQQYPSFLNDTASSPLTNFIPSTTNELTPAKSATPLDSLLKYSHGFSTRDFQRTSAVQQQFGIPQPSLSSHQFQKNQRCGRKKMESIR